MKITFISDVHGESLWKKAVERDSDLFVFLGDYWDSFFVTHKNQISNFEDILLFAENNKDKVKLLLGNHDIHYLLWHTSYFDSMRGSGYSSSLLYKVNGLMREHSDLFNVAWQKDSLLVTHAGLRQDYYDSELKDIHELYPNLNYAGLLNMLWNSRSGKLMRIGKARGGYDDYGGIFWCDRSELIENPVKGLVQVVGHSPLQNIEDIKIDEETRLLFLDCLIYSTKEDKDSLIFTMEL
jgi:predicted MPP superfamily phosphohydrolase